MRISKFKKAKRVFDDISRTPSKYLIIHYSCESFYDIKDGRTPRITSIAIRYFETGQTESFSIHKAAEKEDVCLQDITNQYDELERKMLDDFYNFVQISQNYYWLHWNMRDINFGFKAIEHRYEVLKGKPLKILDNQKIDIARVLIDKYGVGYMSHPRLENLLKKNKITMKNFLNGEEEAKAFEQQEYIKLHQSTLRKVDAFANVIQRSCENTLVTNSKWYEIYGITPQSLFEYFRQSWAWSLFFWLLALVAGAYLGAFIQSKFF